MRTVSINDRCFDIFQDVYEIPNGGKIELRTIPDDEEIVSKKTERHGDVTHITICRIKKVHVQILREQLGLILISTDELDQKHTAEFNRRFQPGNNF